MAAEASQPLLPALIDCFALQEAFTADSHPLSHHLFTLFGGWCAAEEGERDPLVAWLLEAGRGRRPFDIPLVLLAGLHERVLRGLAPSLADYYPTAGGERPPDAPLAAILRAAVMDHRPFLAEALRSWRVQTNETGRGLAWLLPLALTGWARIDLLDLGASAGLNLVADRRRYDLFDDDGQHLAALGGAPQRQFRVRCRGDTGPLMGLRPAGPAVGQRTGCDQAPFHLATAADEYRLMSYIWGDHPARLARLREGIAALREQTATGSPIALTMTRLPEELPDTLEQLLPGRDGKPLVITNTYITRYFQEEAHRLRDIIAGRAAGAIRPVLWLQWEPQDELDRVAEPPQFGWCAWTADLWRSGHHDHLRLGWVHPHGHDVLFEEGLGAWTRLPV